MSEKLESSDAVALEHENELLKAEVAGMINLISDVYQITGHVNGGDERQSARDLRAEVDRLTVIVAALRKAVCPGCAGGSPLEWNMHVHSNGTLWPCMAWTRLEEHEQAAREAGKGKP